MPTDPSWVALALAVLVSATLIAVTAYLARTEADAVERIGLGKRPISRLSRPGTVAKAVVHPNVSDTKNRAAVIVNPSKFGDVDQVHAMVRRSCATHGWADPVWLETTIEDPGQGQARAALEAGVDVVCPLGGDGTVRNVASVLADSGVPIGLLPGGTGNILARNLGLPVDSLRRSLAVVLTGRNAPIDTCSLRLTRPTKAQLQDRHDDPQDEARNVDFDDASDAEETPDIEEHFFLVMAGLGYDAEIMATAEDDDLKSQIGWGAYVLAGAQHLQGPQFLVDVTLADGQHEHRSVRSVITGNVGKLQGGFELLPEARSDDGLVTALLLYPRGVFGWASIARKLVFKRDLPGPQPRLKHLSSTRVLVEVSKPVEVQIDGDTIGAAVVMDVEVNPKSLLVRLPAKA
ncbi:MAG: diacylglycerol kinase family protein [Ornithinimicrobium sp.]